MAASIFGNWLSRRTRGRNYPCNRSDAEKINVALERQSSASFGLLGAALASIIGLKIGWRTAFHCGRSYGVGSPSSPAWCFRIKIVLNSLRHKHVARGDILLLFKRPKRLGKLMLCVLVGFTSLFYCWDC